MEKIQSFFIWCSGASTKLLTECHDAERKKYAAIGATIIFTACFALIASSYAFFTVFHNIPIALALGAFWAITIFNLDRWIVSSMDKRGNFSQQLMKATPRLIIAAIISLVIAKPLELRIFQERVTAEIYTMQIDDNKQGVSDIRSTYKIEALQQELESIETKIASLKQERLGNPIDPLSTSDSAESKQCRKDLAALKVRLETRKLELQAKINSIWNDTSNFIILDGEKTFINQDIRTTYYDLIAKRDGIKNEIAIKSRSCGNLASSVVSNQKRHQSKIDEELELLQGRRADTVKEITKAKAAIGEASEKLEDVNKISFSPNLITQIEALGNLTAKDDNLKYTSMFIMLLFFVFETAPVFVKLLSSRGHYDDLDNYYQLQLNADLDARMQAEVMTRRLELESLAAETRQKEKIVDIEAQMKSFSLFCEQLESSQAEYFDFVSKWMADSQKVKDEETANKYFEMIDNMTETFFKTQSSSKEIFDASTTAQ